MKEMEETKRFNVEDITIDDKKEIDVSLENDNKDLEEIRSEEDNEDSLKIESFTSDMEKDKKEITGNEAAESSLEDIVKNDFQEQTIVQLEIPEGKKIGIASDHRGYNLKQKLTKYLGKKGYTVIDYGTDNRQSCDYPDFGFKLGEAVANDEVSKGIAICGSGIGISIACNKIKGVRCAKVDNVKEVKYSRRDNDANVIAIAGNMPLFRAKDIVDVYLKTKFTGLQRHQKRINMLNDRG